MCDDKQKALVFGRDHQFLEGVNRFRDDLRNLRQRWDNRLILERRSLAEFYLDGRLEIVAHGDWRVGSDEYHWACRIKSEANIAKCIGPDPGINVIDRNGSYHGDEKIVLVVLVEGIKVPKVLIRSTFRPYLIEKKFFGTGEGLLYRRESGVGYEIFPWGDWKIKWPRKGRAPFSDNTAGKMIECSSEIADRVTDDTCERLWNVLFGPVGKLKNGGFNVQDCCVFFSIGNLVEGFIERDGSLPKFVNVAVGPLNL